MHPELEAWRAAGRYFDHLGFRIFYRMEGSGPPLLAVHGYPFNSWDWALIWPELTRRFTVIAPDLIGLGFSDKPVSYRYSVHDHADTHEALLDHLGVTDVHMLAHDLGDSVGQELLARQEFGEHAYGTPRYRTITWLNGGMFCEAYTPRPVQKLMSQTPLGELLGPLQGSRFSRRLLEPTLRQMFGVNTQPTAEMMAKFHQILEFNDGKRVLHKVGRFLDDRLEHRNRWVRAMRATSVPMRLIDGPADPNSGAHMAARYRELIPNADVVMLADDIGHWPQIEAPDAVLEHLLA